MTEYIENEVLLPSLQIGVPEDVFWKKTPKTLQVYFKAYRKRKEEEAKRWSQKMWEMGQYVRMAIANTVVVAGLYNGKHMSDNYPKCPYIEIENNPGEHSEQWVENEKLRLRCFLNSLGKHR